MDFSLCRRLPEWGVLGLEPNWQKSAKPVGIMYTEGRRGLVVFNGLEKSTNNQMKNLRKCLLNREYRNATSKYLKIMLFYHIGRSGILVIKM